MPAPARTTSQAIVDAASRLLEEHGLEAMTMAEVADRVGVRGPSLYKRVPSRALLIRAVAEQAAADLAKGLEAGIASSRDPRAGLRAAAEAHRAFVHAHPNGYGLLFAHLLPESMPDAALVGRAGLPIVRAMEEIVGPARSLEAARTFVAWAHGFVSMELAGAFRLGGDVDAAFRYGVEATLAGIAAQASEQPEGVASRPSMP
jgi:AcrR family transcriptional regulator